jgi:PAS domain S-box-containing protein
MLYRLNLESGRYDYIGEAASDLTGYDAEEFLSGGTAMHDVLVHPEDTEMVTSHFQRLFESRSNDTISHTLEYRMRHRNGSYRWLSDSHSLIHDQTGTPRLLIGSVRDISDQRLADDALKQAHSRLQNEQKALKGKNIALKELLDQINERGDEVRINVQTNIDKVALPLLASIREKLDPDLAASAGMLEQCLKDIASPYVSALEKAHGTLTQREIKICTMIKGGMQSKEIAKAMDISVRTVEKFRQQIRHKLGLTHKQVNLPSYLKSFQSGTA